MNNKRITRLLNILKEKNADAILIYDRLNRRYLSGFTGSTAYLYISEKQRVILTDFRYIEQATNECPDFEVVDMMAKGYTATLNEIIAKDNISSIAFEDTIVTFSDYAKLKEELTVKEFIPVGNEVDEIRMVKDEEELEIMEKAVEIGDKAFSYILDILRPGVSEIDVAIELEFFMRKNGATKLSFDSIVASGVHSSMPHAQPTNKLLEVGDFVTMDFGCIYKGYCSDMTRTVVIGKASDKQKEIYNTVLDAQLNALNTVRAGLTGIEVDKVARDIITDAGYGNNFGHGLGHGVGLNIHESPRLSVVGKHTLRENMVVTVEPGIYIPNFGGVRIEDLVVVKENGCINYTKSTKELIEIL